MNSGLHQTELTCHFFKDFKKLRLIHTRFTIEKMRTLCYFKLIINSGGKSLNSLYKNLVFWAIIIVIMIFLFNLFNRPRQTVLEKNYSDFISAVENNKVSEVEAQGRNIDLERCRGQTLQDLCT